MGLLDVLNSIQGGGVSSDPRAQSAQAGMSPMAKALLALLAVYAARNLRQAGAPSTPPAQPRPAGGGTSAGPSTGTGGLPGGDLGDLLRGTLGGLLGGAGAGTVLNGGLGGLLKQLQESGHGEVAKSWVGTGPNKQISEGDLADALGTNTLNEVSRQSGVDRGDLLSGLRQYLPHFVDQLTPDGRVPSEEEASRMV